MENPTVATLTDAVSTDATTSSADTETARDAGAVTIESELLIEEISIDGMCGVY